MSLGILRLPEAGLDHSSHAHLLEQLAKQTQKEARKKKNIERSAAEDSILKYNKSCSELSECKSVSLQ